MIDVKLSSFQAAGEPGLYMSIITSPKVLHLDFEHAPNRAEQAHEGFLMNCFYSLFCDQTKSFSIEKLGSV